MKKMEILENEITGVMETSSFCRGELCRSLEPELDRLGYELSGLCSSEGTCSNRKVADLQEKIRMSYKHILSDMHY